MRLTTPAFRGRMRIGLLLMLLGNAWAGELPGTLAWGDRVSMGTLVSGMVAEVAVRPGQRVAKGDLLVSFDSRGFRAELNGARAELARAEILLEEARREQARALELYERTVLSEHERTLAEIDLRKAQARDSRARAELVRATLDHERSQLRAPQAGVVLAVHVSAGEAVLNTLRSEPLVELAVDQAMWFRGAVDLATAQQIANAKPRVEVHGQRLESETVEIGFEPVEQGPAGARYPVDVRFRRPEALTLRAGEAAKLLW